MTAPATLRRVQGFIHAHVHHDPPPRTVPAAPDWDDWHWPYDRPLAETDPTR